VNNLERCEIRMSSEISELLIKTFWEDIGPLIRPEKINEKVYHYTSLEGIMGILESESMWMTKSDFLNDVTEIVFFKTLKEEAISKLDAHITKTYGEGMFSDVVYKTFIESFNSAYEMRFEKPVEVFEVYVLSLSENDDSLTLWGNYSKGNGYNISFDTNTLLKEVRELDNFTIVYGKVIYDKTKQINALSESLLNTFDIVKKIDSEPDELNKELLAYFKSLITSYSIFFKHPAFSHEEEFRIALTANEKADVSFRSNGEIIIPYIEVEFEKKDVKGIGIGPKNNNDIAENGISTFLDRLGYNVAEIKINKSSVPLRY
jgi:hypothetical protein